MIGRPRFLRPFWSGRAEPAAPAPATSLRGPEEFPVIQALQFRRAEGRVAELEAERDAAVKATLEIAEGVRAALAGSAYFIGVRPANVVDGVERLAEAHRELGRAHSHCVEDKAKYRRQADALATELDQVKAALEIARVAPRSQSGQDRRNARLLCDALALSEGRRYGAPLSDAGAAHELLAAVRKTVTEHLGVDLEEVPPWTR